MRFISTQNVSGLLEAQHKLQIGYCCREDINVLMILTPRKLIVWPPT
nr:MAG TPA: hypothetical protein [Caudoviricetes sp.]